MVMHIHDEVVVEAAEASAPTVDEICDILATASAWAEGLHLTAEGFRAGYYKKD